MIGLVNQSRLAVFHTTVTAPEVRFTIVAKGEFGLTGGCFSEDVTLDSVDLVATKPNTDILVSAKGPRAESKCVLSVGGHRILGPMQGFAPLAFEHAERVAKLGTFDERWLEERWPYYPSDFDPSYFNCAPSALQIDEPRGDETITFEHEHLGKTVAQLPGLRVRAFLHAEETFEEMPLMLDTVHLDVDRERLALTWRGCVDAVDVDNIYLVTEPLDEEPLAVAHHQSALRVALLEQPSAADETPPPAANDNAPADDAVEDQKNVAELLSMLKSAGTPAHILEVVESAGTMKGALAALSDLVNPDPKKAEEVAALAMAEMRRVLEEAGEDPTAFDFDDDDEAHEDHRWTRLRVVACAKAGESMEGADLRALDLSELDLSGSKLTDALMDDVNLRQATLYGADLNGVTMPRADLTGAVLGNASLVDADLTGIKGEGVDLRHAALSGALFDGAVMPQARFEHARAKGASFRKADVTGAQFRQSDLENARFDDGVLHGASFGETTLTDASFEAARGDDVVFHKANLLRVRGGEAAFFRADLRDVRGDESGWLGADLREAKLTLGTFRRADLSHAQLDGAAVDGADCADADFTESQLSGASLLGANFAGACFTRADLSRADARKANFYEAELWNANTQGTRLAEAHLAMTKLAPKESSR